MKHNKWKYRKKGIDIVIECDRKQMIQLPRDAEKTYNALTASKNQTLTASNLTQEIASDSS